MNETAVNETAMTNCTAPNVTVLVKDDPPDLQALVTTFGRYANVPDWAWEAFDQEREDWEERRRDRLLGGHTWKLMAGWKAKKARANRRRK